MIKQSVINTFERCHIPYKELQDKSHPVTVNNRFGFGSCETTPLIAYLIQWVYNTGDQFELGGGKHIRVDDFDRIRYFVLEQDPNAYQICLD